MFTQKNQSRLHNPRGMTLVELVIASTILMMIFTVTMSTYANFTSAKRKLLLSNEIHSETVFLLERIAREVHNGTIDYQGYWRENLMNKSARYWAHESGEGVSPSGDRIPNDDTYRDSPIINGLNSYKNCDSHILHSINSNREDTDTLEKRKNILFNYRYQFIFPGKVLPDGNTSTETENKVNLNCTKDNYNENDGYNVYDDEPAYGNGPRAFGEVGSNADKTYKDTDLEANSARSSKMLWDWNAKQELETTGSLNLAEKQNPPLLLVKKLVTPNEGNTYERSALRFKDGSIELIRFLGKDTDTSPPDFIADEWRCDLDFGCGPSGSISYDGSYIWSQKETKKNSSGNNGIGSVTDSDLQWKNITPEKLEITSFEFILSPVKDPHRAFSEKTRIQKPQVTIILEVQAKSSALKGTKGLPPKIRVQTTVTPRVWDLVEVDN